MQTFGRENSSRNNHVEEIGRVVPTATGQPERPATVGASTDTQTFELFFFFFLLPAEQVVSCLILVISN